MQHHEPQSPPPITRAHVIVTVLILIALGLTLALFMVPGTSPWFWPIAVALAVVGVAAMVVPIKPRTP